MVHILAFARTHTGCLFVLTLLIWFSLEYHFLTTQNKWDDNASSGDFFLYRSRQAIGGSWCKSIASGSVTWHSPRALWREILNISANDEYQAQTTCRHFLSEKSDFRSSFVQDFFVSRSYICNVLTEGWLVDSRRA